MGLNGRKIDSGGFEFIYRFLRPLGCLIYVMPINRKGKLTMKENEKTDMQYAGFWFRVIAAIVDEIICIIATILVAFPLGFALGASMAGISTMEEIKAASEGLGSVLGILIPWLYFTVSESSTWQATLGKKMFGLSVTDMDGNKISFGRANSRYWSQIISALILLIGFIMVAFTERKQGLHDIIAGTLVMRKA